MERRPGMRAGNQLYSAQSQKQKLTRAVIQGVELLVLPVAVMRSHLAEVILSNPMLELTDPAGAGSELLPQPGSLSGEGGVDEFPAHRGGRTGASAYDADDLFNLRGTQFELETLSGSLELQLFMCGLNAVEHAIGREIIGNLDERGYFIGSLPTICCFHGVPQDVGQRVLSTVQEFVPRGIAARNVYECLCLQVGEEAAYPETTRRVILEDLEHLVDNRVTECARKYHMSQQSMREIFAYIRTLEPHPGNCDAPRENVCYTQPDLVIRKHGGEYTVRISGEWETPLRLNAEYLHMLDRDDLTPGERDYLRTNLEEARMLMRNLTMRQQIIHKFALALLRLQKDFFRRGAAGLRPMTMLSMAQEMGVNVSTVSRVVQGKYMDTPWGLYPFKYFFTGACVRDGEKVVSVQIIKDRIKELAGSGQRAQSLNDTQICAKLQEAGYRISRRTVTKYRQALGLARQERHRSL